MPTVLPKPAKAYEVTIRKDDSRVKGRRGTLATDDGTEVEGGIIKEANEEVCTPEAEGSNVHDSHRSKVAAVSPCESTAVDLAVIPPWTSPRGLGFRLIPTRLLW